MENINKTKRCTKCNRELPIECFGNNKTKKDGLQSWCRECSNGYSQTYNKTHKEHYKQYYKANKQHRNQYDKEYYKQFKGYYLYIIQDKNNKIVYVGQTTTYYYRLMHHLSENVNSTKELFANGDWSCIKYLDVSNFVENEMELRALENILIELYEPRLNTLLNVIRDIDRGRLFSLLAQLHSILNEWEIFRTNI